jgi:Ca-activated chloride channel family protein
LQSVEAAMGVLQPAVSSDRANGSTNLHAGWLKASELLAPHAGGEAVCHVMLLSDGLANAPGSCRPPKSATRWISLANAGVTTTTVGLGSDFNEQLMTAMAQSGCGRAR